MRTNNHLTTRQKIEANKEAYIKAQQQKTIIVPKDMQYAGSGLKFKRKLETAYEISKDSTLVFRSLSFEERD